MHFRLEEFTTSFFNLALIEKINYRQYSFKKQDEKWGLHIELKIRKNNPKAFVAVFSRELWCFSINDEPIDSITQYYGDQPPDSEKSGDFSPLYSKPNLPLYYAIFLKSLRKTIYNILAMKSENTLLPFANAMISLKMNKNDDDNEMIGDTSDLNPKTTKSTTFIEGLYQLTPHLFENGNLTVLLSCIDWDLIPFTTESINRTFLADHSLYFAPSGLRMALFSTQFNKCVTSPPSNAESLLRNLKISHGIDLPDPNEITWIKILPQIGLLNYFSQSIARNIEQQPSAKYLVWPINLCFAQKAFDAKQSSTLVKGSPLLNELSTTFDLIDDFISLRQSSSLRTLASSGTAPGTLAGTNPLSSGGGYSDHFQQFYRNIYSNSNSGPGSYGQSIINEKVKVSPNEIIQRFSPLDHALSSSSAEPFHNGLLNTPVAEGNQLFRDNERKPSPDFSELAITKLDLEKNLNYASIDKSTTSADQFPNDQENVPSSKQDTVNDPLINKELFGDDDDEDIDDLFGDFNDSQNEDNDVKMSTKGDSDEITEEMFELSDDEDIRSFSNKKGNDPTIGLNGNSMVSASKVRTKRKYLDIPMDEMTLPGTPLYVDPGAPLPVETPKDKNKSVFAPLNFNPIIESNVDNKYKNGGKFSFSPQQNEETLSFDISTNNISSSEDEDDSDESEIGDELPSPTQVKSSENFTQDPVLLPFESSQVSAGLSSTELIKQDSISATTAPTEFVPTGDLPKDGMNSIWKIPQYDIQRTVSPLKSYNSSNYSGDHLFIKGNLEQNKTENSSVLDSNEQIPNIKENEAIELNNDTKMFNSLLPFLLRHIPLSSMAQTFSSSNTSVLISGNKQFILNIIAEQIVFDYNLLQSLNVPKRRFKNIEGISNGIFDSSLKQIFGTYNQIDGGEILSDLYSMEQPSVFVKKHHSIIKIRGDSQEFSKYINLKPYSAIKNFRFLLLSASFKEDCASFVSTFCQTYIGYEYGFCELPKLSNDHMQGLMYLKDFDKHKLLLLAAQIVSYCSNNKGTGNDVPLLIMIPLESNSLSEIVDKTTKFLIIQNEVRSKIPSVQILLKVIPMEFIKSSLTSVDEYTNLCTSVYNILPNKTVKFAKIAPHYENKIRFSSLSTSTQTTIHYDSLVHLAYARSVDKHWVFAAFSDSTGSITTLKTWYVGNSSSKFDEACNEIWSIAMKIAVKKFGKICIILTRLNNVLPDDELMNWRRLSGRLVHLAVVCVDNSSRISFIDKDQHLPSFKPLLRNPHLEKKFNVDKLDDYEIRDIYQDVYGAIFENPLPLANSQHRCAIKSGALVKFNVKTDGMNLLDALEVNLLNCPHSNSTQLLESILEEFRNLSALNPWFSVAKYERANIPWHVLAVEKMMRTMVHINVKQE